MFALISWDLHLAPKKSNDYFGRESPVRKRIDKDFHFAAPFSNVDDPLLRGERKPNGQTTLWCDQSSASLATKGSVTCCHLGRLADNDAARHTARSRHKSFVTLPQLHRFLCFFFSPALGRFENEQKAARIVKVSVTETNVLRNFRTAIFVQWEKEKQFKKIRVFECLLWRFYLEAYSYYFEKIFKKFLKLERMNQNNMARYKS